MGEIAPRDVRDAAAFMMRLLRWKVLCIARDCIGKRKQKPPRKQSSYRALPKRPRRADRRSPRPRRIAQQQDLTVSPSADTRETCVVPLLGRIPVPEICAHDLPA